MPAGLSRAGLETWAADHANEVICDLPYDGRPEIRCPAATAPAARAARQIHGPTGTPVPATPAQLKAAAVQIANQDYADYKTQFLSPSDSLMIKTGLWLELEAVIGFIVGLGLASLLGQRTVAVVMMIVLEIILTPSIIRARIPHLQNVQRAVVGLATAHLEPGPAAVGVRRWRASTSGSPSRPPWPSASSSPGSSDGPSSAPGA